MNKKGQIFSIDFIIAAILVIFFLGVILGTGEIKNYEQKERLILEELEEKSGAALIVLSNSQDFSCNTTTNQSLAYSIDVTKINAHTLLELKEKIGLKDYHVFVSMDGTLLGDKNDLSYEKNVYALDVSVLACESAISFSDINGCLNNNCPATITKKVLTLGVGK